MPRETEFLSIHAPNALDRAVQIVQLAGSSSPRTPFMALTQLFDPQALHALYMAKDRRRTRRSRFCWLNQPGGCVHNASFVQGESPDERILAWRAHSGILKRAACQKNSLPHAGSACSGPSSGTGIAFLTGPWQSQAPISPVARTPQRQRCLRAYARPGRFGTGWGVLESGKASTIVD